MYVNKYRLKKIRIFTYIHTTQKQIAYFSMTGVFCELIISTYILCIFYDSKFSINALVEVRMLRRCTSLKDKEILAQRERVSYSLEQFAILLKETIIKYDAFNSGRVA